MRFVYCAAAVSHMLDNWSGMDREKTKEYVLQSMVRARRGGGGGRPGEEGGVGQCTDCHRGGGGRHDPSLCDT